MDKKSRSTRDARVTMQDDLASRQSSGSSRPMTSQESLGDRADYDGTLGSSEMGGQSGMVGTGLSRFLGFYNPAFDENFTKKNREVDPGSREMQEAYQHEIKQKQSNRKKDWMSVYMDEQVKYSAISKVATGKQ